MGGLGAGRARMREKSEEQIAVLRGVSIPTENAKQEAKQEERSEVEICNAEELDLKTKAVTAELRKSGPWDLRRNEL